MNTPETDALRDLYENREHRATVGDIWDLCEAAEDGSSPVPCCASLIVHDPSDLPKCDGEILVALWGAHEWEIVNVRENINGPFTAEYKSTGDPADPTEWQWWADLHCMILHNNPT